MHSIFFVLITEIASDCLDDCITYDEESKKMTFDFKYLRDSPYDNLDLIQRSVRKSGKFYILAA